MMSGADDRGRRTPASALGAVPSHPMQELQVRSSRARLATSVWSSGLSSEHDSERGSWPGVAGVPILAYGNFITIVINFILLAFVIFMLVKALNVWRRQPDPASEAPPAPTEDQKLLGEIRDLLKAGR